jgi:hypothetical protein
VGGGGPQACLTHRHADYVTTRARQEQGKSRSLQGERGQPIPTRLGTDTEVSLGERRVLGGRAGSLRTVLHDVRFGQENGRRIEGSVGVDILVETKEVGVRGSCRERGIVVRFEAISVILVGGHGALSAC